MKSYIWLVLLILIYSCNVDRKDKHPDIPYFSTDLSSDITFTPVPEPPRYKGHNASNIFLSTNDFKENPRLLVYTLDSKIPVADIPLEDRNPVIDEEGNIYGYNNTLKEAFGYTSTTYTRKSISSLSLKHLNDKNIQKEYKNQIAAKKLSGVALSQFTKDIQQEKLKSLILDSLQCMVKLPYQTYGAILKFPNSEVYTNSSLLFTNTLLVLKDKIAGINNCPLASYNEDKMFPNGDEHISKTDHITLSYSLEGSNHIAMGVSTKELFYYQLKIDGKTLAFKHPKSVHEIKHLNKDLIIKVDSVFYNVTTKK